MDTRQCSVVKLFNDFIINQNTIQNSRVMGLSLPPLLGHCLLMSSCSRLVTAPVNSLSHQGSSHYHHHGEDLSAQAYSLSHIYCFINSMHSSREFSIGCEISMVSFSTSATLLLARASGDFALDISFRSSCDGSIQNIITGTNLQQRHATLYEVTLSKLCELMS